MQQFIQELLANMQVKVFRSWTGLQECGLLWDQPKALPTFTKIVSDECSLYICIYIHIEREREIMLIFLLPTIIYMSFAGHPRIIHRDIKTANILLDDHYEAKVFFTI